MVVATEDLDLGLPSHVAVIASDAEAITTAGAYANRVAPGAPERDRTGALPLDELRDLAATGLLGIRVPRSHGGAQVTNATVAEVFRIIAVADPALAQIPQNHFAFVDLLDRRGTSDQRDFFHAEFLRGARLGNALSERGGRTSRDYSTRLTRRPDGSYRLTGRKYYCTGALTAQWIPAFARDDEDEISVAYLPRTAPGVAVEQDWAAFGQRSTISGTVTFTDVEVDPEWVVPRALGDHGPSTFAAFGQIIHAAIEVGLARGALTEGAAFLRNHARPWMEAGVDRAADDEHLLRLAGELDAQVRASEALLGRAADALDVAERAPGDPGAVTEARLAVAAAKAFSGEVALHVATALFDFSGASAADSRYALDRHWRNARTHTLHDPARSKHIHLGRYLVSRTAPPTDHPLI